MSLDVHPVLYATGLITWAMWLGVGLKTEIGFAYRSIKNNLIKNNT
jgi:hypothetical protein